MSLTQDHRGRHRCTDGTLHYLDTRHDGDAQAWVSTESCPQCERSFILFDSNGDEV